MSARPVRIANCSGFYGDRIAAAREMLAGPIDVLTGDYLAELTMLILWKARQKDPDRGYATTFLRQLEDVLGSCLERGIKVVVNAGGLNPAGLAAKVTDLAGALGLTVKVAYLDGDDLLPRLGDLQAAGHEFTNLDTGAPLAQAGLPVVSANAYLGGWGITAALRASAGIVICPRVTDASLVTGPAAWWHDWQRDDFDALAGAVAAGHIIECGPQATGGNYSFLDEISDYLNPDVTAYFDTIELRQAGPDRVALSGTRGSPPPDSLKVAINLLGGYRNTTTMVLSFDHPDAPANEEATAHLRITVKDPDERKVGRAFSDVTWELALGGYPGFHTTTPPTPASAFGVYWPALVPVAEVTQVVHGPDGAERVVSHTSGRPAAAIAASLAASVPAASVPPDAARVAVPLGRIAGARSGDKGGNANVGLWARSEAGYAWLEAELTVEAFRKLLPEAAGLGVRRYLLPNLRAVNFVVEGLLAPGVAATTRPDAQAKGLGEYLRSRTVSVPAALLRAG